MILVQRCCDRPVVERALANAHPQPGRNQWIRPGHKDVVQFAARLPADDENILETFRGEEGGTRALALEQSVRREDRKSTRLNSSHPSISYAVFCLKKKNNARSYACFDDPGIYQP